VTGYGIYVANVRVATTTTTQYDFDDLNCGSNFAVAVDAVDAAGNRSAKTPFVVTTDACNTGGDKAAPSTPSGLAATSSSGSSVSFAWTASTDDIGVTGYGVYRNGSLLGTASGTSYTATGLACGQSYEFAVDAFDAAGNRSGKATATLAAAACPDTTAPTTPTGLTRTAASATSMSLSWSPSSDTVGVTGYGVYRNGTLAGTTSGTTYTVTGLTCGQSYTVAVDAVDAAGNRSGKATATWSTAACADATAPTTPTGLTQTGRSATSVSLSWSASSDAVGVTGYGVYRDGTLAGSASGTTYTVSGLACGQSYSFAVDAVDAAGNRSGKATATFASAPCPDTTPPTVPANLIRTAVSTSSVSLSWSASTDAGGVTGYGVYRNGTLLGSTAATSYSSTGLACGTSYTFEVDAVDGAGNRSAKAALFTTTAACVDATAPTTPTGLAQSGSTTTSIGVSWAASSDNVGVTGYRVLVNGSVKGTPTSTSYTATGLTCGTSYAVAVDASDAAGNRSGQATATMATAPCPPPTPPPGDTQAPTAPSLSQASLSGTSVGVGWTGSTDNVGVTGYALFRNGTQIATVGASATTYTFGSLTCATSYTFGVEAFDAAGNRSTRSTLTRTTSACTDTEPPSLMTNQRITGTTQTTATMAWSPSTDNVGVTGYRAFLDGTAVGTTTALSYTYTGLQCGTTYTVALEAFDAAGNVSDRRYATGPATTAACATTDTQPPSAPPSLASTGTTQTSVSLFWSPSLDNVGVTGYGVYNAATLAGSTTSTSYTVTGLACGTSYSLSVDARDAAGNRSARSTLVVSTAACTSSPPPSGSGAAHLWVDASGGSCVDSSTQVPYSDAQACSWQQANATCEGGDTVLVKGGSYGNLSIRGSNGRTSACTFRTASGESVTAGSLNLGEWQTCQRGASSTTTTNWFTLVGPIKTREFHADCSDRVTVDGLDMDAGGVQITQPFQVQADATNFTLRNSKVHNALNANAMMVLEGSNFVLDGNDIYDGLNNTNGVIHDECLRAQPVDNMTMTRNHFWSCAVMNVFITGTELATNWLVENNVFEAPLGSSGNAANGFAFRGGGSPSPSPDGFVMRYNTFGSTGVQINSSDNPVTSRGFSVYGNYFATNPPCGQPGASYSHNITPTGVSNCGGTGAASFAASTLNAGFVRVQPYTGNQGGSRQPAGDYRLVAGSPLISRANPAAYPALDMLGVTRMQGPGPDVGAYEVS
jgi:chitodextrinase